MLCFQSCLPIKTDLQQGLTMFDLHRSNQIKRCLILNKCHTVIKCYVKFRLILLNQTTTRLGKQAKESETNQFGREECLAPQNTQLLTWKISVMTTIYQLASFLLVKNLTNHQKLLRMQKIQEIQSIVQEPQPQEPGLRFRPQQKHMLTQQ